MSRNVIPADFGNGNIPPSSNHYSALRQNLTNDVIEADRKCALAKAQVEALGFTVEEFLAISVFALAKADALLARHKLNEAFGSAA